MKCFFLTVTFLSTIYSGLVFSAVEFISINSIEKFSDDYAFGEISSFFVYKDEIFVTDRRSKKVYIFDFEGTPLFKFGSDRNLGGSPTDLAILDDKIYIIFDDKSSIEIFNILGNKIGEIPPPYEGFKPRIITVADRQIMIVDMGNKKICFFDQSGKMTSSFDNNKTLPPISGAFYKNEKVYIISPVGAPVVRIFTKEGGFLSGFGRISESSSQFSTPSSITVDNDGILWVSDSFRAVASGFKEDGTPVSVLSGKWTKKGQFNFPSKVLFSQDTTFVLETGANKITVLKKENRP